MRLILVFAFLLLIPNAASAHDIKQCGVASTYDAAGHPPLDYCNFYPRRFDYLESSKALRSKLEQRARNYNALRTQALDDYERRRSANWDYAPGPEILPK